MSASVRVTPEAGDDLRRGAAYFDARRPGLGTEFFQEAFATFDRIADMPLGYGEVDDGVRAEAMHRFGYVVYYRGDESTVEVIAVLHGSRSSKTWHDRI